MINQDASYDFINTSPDPKPKSDFIRKGVVGGYKDEMSPEFIKKFDNWLSPRSKL